MTEKEKEIREKAEKFLDDRYDLTGPSSIVYIDTGAYVDFALSCVRNAVREQKEKDAKIAETCGEQGFTPSFGSANGSIMAEIIVAAIRSKVDE